MNLLETARQQAAAVVKTAYEKAVAAGALPQAELPPVAVEIPKDASNGDWASTFAMQCAKPLRCAPRKIAQAIVDNLSLEGTCFEKIEIAGPGFLNFTLNQSWYQDAVRAVLACGKDYGRTKSEHPEKIMVEFVSANPPRALPMCIGPVGLAETNSTMTFSGFLLSVRP